MAQPVMSYNIRPGGEYWAAWGSKGWSAVRVTSVKRKWAKVTRVDAKSGAIKKKGAKVRADEMVKRDPALNGSDKPEKGPDEVFADVRKYREAEESKQLILTKEKEEAAVAAPIQPELTREELRAQQLAREQETVKRWKRVEASYDPDVVASWPSDTDW